MLLLHLLQFDQGQVDFRRLLGALDQDAPVFGDGQLAIEGRRLFAGLDVDGHVQLAVGFSTEDAMGRRNIGIVSPDGGANVAVVGDEVVGGIEPDPAEVRQQNIDPRVGRIRRRPVMIFAAAVEIPRDISRRDANVPQKGNHGVGESPDRHLSRW